MHPLVLLVLSLARWLLQNNERLSIKNICSVSSEAETIDKPLIKREAGQSIEQSAVRTKFYADWKKKIKKHHETRELPIHGLALLSITV